MGPDLDLFAAAKLVPYLAELGVSHIYCSPFMQSAPEAAHGYAVVDPRRVDDRLGGDEGRLRLTDAASVAGMGIMVDLVPNHMAVSLPSNRWFWEVLEHGPSSRFAEHFDVDWDPPESTTHHKVLLPILGDHYGRELEAGAIRFVHDRGEFTVRYHDHVLPASPRSVAMVVEAAAANSHSEGLAYVARSLRALPPADATDPASRRRRHADADFLFGVLTDLSSQPEVRRAVDEAIEAANRDPDRLDELLEQQNYRLARWQVADQELGYRRFFDIDTLIGLRVEDPAVFEDTHAVVFEWVEAGDVHGLRIDHPDGLRRPGEYLARLRQHAPRAWIVVEKILEDDEQLPGDWPVDGSTGYDFMTDVTALLVDHQAEAAMTELWQEVSGSDQSWEATADAAKREVVRDMLAGDVNRLTQAFLDVTAARRRYRDFTRAELSEALVETLVGFEVYRTYVGEEGDVTPTDRHRIEQAIGRARDAAPDLDPELFELLGGILTGAMEGDAEVELRMRFQQLTGVVMAKGVEDTAFYRYLRLVALCEVGGNPGRFGLASVDEFHRRCRDRQEHWPATMLSLSTHDTKRSEDVRARLAVLSEIPEEWRDAVVRWRRHNDRHRPVELDGATEYLIYQTLVGAHPIDASRLVAYVEKATKEAKTHTSWTAPDSDYDAAVAGFVRQLCDDAEFIADLEDFVGPIVEAGRINSLVQKAIQLTSPGVPDVYQGNELWDLSLVDPDNRRAVDHGLRGRLLEELEDATPETVLERMDEGLPKLWLTQQLLQLRRRHAALGPHADYRPLDVTGDAAGHVVAYVRGDAVATVTPRLTLRLRRGTGHGDAGVVFPAGRWHDVLTGESVEGSVAVGRLLARFPVAVLVRE